MNKKNNFDFLRFVFAIMVVVSHAYPLSGDTESSQWIYKITDGQIVWASIGLNGFFVISGFFIYKSLIRSSNLLSYFRKRFLRLFPGLFVVLLLTILLAPNVYKGDIPFFMNREVYTYVPNNMMLYTFQSSIKGIFDNNSYHSINGSLWTLRYEFSLYVAIAILYFVKRKLLVTKVILFSSLVLLIFVCNTSLDRFAGSSIIGMQGYHILNFSAFFVCGSFLASLGFDEIKNKGKLFMVVFLLLVVSVLIVSVYFNKYNTFKHILFPIIILLIGYFPIPLLSNFRKIGDMSYGIYIYSFPIEQTFMYYFKFNIYELMISSLVVSIIFGYLSWHFIEKKALKYKKDLYFNSLIKQTRQIFIRS